MRPRRQWNSWPVSSSEALNAGGSPSEAGTTVTPPRADAGSRFTQTIRTFPSARRSVGEQLVVLGLEEVERPRAAAARAFSRRIAFSFPTSGRSGPSSVRLLHLVLLRVEVLLAARPHRDVLEVLVAGVHPVARRQRRGEHEPRLERRPPAALEVLVEDVGRVREEVRPEELRQLERVSSVMYSISSAFVFFQVK